MTQLNFNAKEVEPNAFGVLPAGDYIAQIVESEMLPTRSDTGSYLKLVAEVMEGPYKGRKLFDRLNLDNPNAQAVEIAQRTLSSICRAVGVLNLTDSEQLHFKPLKVTVRVRPAGPDRDDIHRDEQNEVRRYGPAKEDKDGKGSGSNGNGGSTPPVAAWTR